MMESLVADPLLMTVRARVGIAGVGRLATILSLCGPAGACLGYAEWLGLLQATPHEYDLLVTVLRELQVFTTQATDEPSRIRFEPGPAWAPTWAARPVHLTLMPDAAAWAAWCQSELAMPGWLLETPETQALFRRWCASNVTVDEATQAVLQAVAGGDVSPSTIHQQLALVRKSALQKASR
ncbi:hypothetical protein [Pseudomonas fluorescens group sp. PF-69]